MKALNAIPRETMQQLMQELGGERILWAGQPSPAQAFRKNTMIWFFAIPWTAFSLLWEGSAFVMLFGDQARAPGIAGWAPALVFPLFGLPFVLIGLGMMATPFWRARKARSTIHVLTDKRLVTAIAGRSLSIESIPPGRVISVLRQEGAEGFGTVSLSLGGYRDSDGDLVEKNVQLLGVPEARALETHLLALMEQGRAPD